jgi:hypothetical protein
MFFVWWVLMCVICYYISKLNIRLGLDFDDEMGFLVLYIIFMLVPYFNIVLAIFFLGFSLYKYVDDNYCLNVEEVAKKIFRVKDKE